MNHSARRSETAKQGWVGRAFRWARQAWKTIDRADALLLLSAFVVVGCVFLFHEMGESITGVRVPQLDEKIIRSLRVAGRPGEPLGPFWLRSAMRDFTALGSPTLLILFVLTIAGALMIRKQHHAVVLLLVATLGAQGLNAFLKAVFARPRPDPALHLTEVVSASFPSGHAMDSATIYLITAAVLSRLVEPLALKLYCVAVAMLLTFVIGISRVYLGVHYPSDVLAGWTAGLGWALFCWTLASWLQRRGALEQPK
jgi:undecaprenyl-diphosphatase